MMSDETPENDKPQTDFIGGYSVKAEEWYPGLYLEHVSESELIERLQEDDGDSVAIASESAPVLVTCNGRWTGLVERHFTGPTLRNALVAAVIAKGEEKPRNYQSWMGGGITMTGDDNVNSAWSDDTGFGRTYRDPSAA